MGKIIDAIFIFLGCIWYIIIWGLGLKFLFYFHKYISDNSFLNFKTLLSINPNQPYYSLATFMIRETRIGLDVVGSQIMGLLFLKKLKLLLIIMKIQKIKILFQKMIIMNGMKI